MENIVTIKFRKKLRTVDADAGDLELKPGDKVMMEARGGPLLGTVAPKLPCKCKLKDTHIKFAKIVGRAGDTDLRQEELNIRMEGDYFRVCQKKIQKHNLPMKLVDVDIVPDGSKVIFFFVAESRVDFRSLVKELAADLRTRIEMRQIGARSEAQKVGGIGCCGRELCCVKFLQKFAPVTVRMTKEQGLPLDPEKISGVCGRLMCCLAYEYEAYVELKKGLPKVGKRVQLPQGSGKIRQVNVLSKIISVEMEDGVMAELRFDDFRQEMLIKK